MTSHHPRHHTAHASPSAARWFERSATIRAAAQLGAAEHIAAKLRAEDHPGGSAVHRGCHR